MTARPSIAVILACHDRRAKTLACLASVAAQTVDAGVHVVVYDDGSRDGTAEAVRTHHPDAVILQGTGTAFWAGGMRAAFDHALARGFDHYLWLNDDVVLAPNAIARLLAVAREATAAGRRLVLVGGAVADPRTQAFAYGGIERRSGRALRFIPVRPSQTAPRFCDTLHGNVVLVPAATARALGSIGRAYIHALGDLDYGLRVREAGGAVILAPGYLGWCEANPRASRFFDAGTPLEERWRLLGDPLGFPPRPWLHFARAHGGRFWWIAAARPFWRLLVPARIARRLGRLRSAHARAA